MGQLPENYYEEIFPKKAKKFFAESLIAALREDSIIQALETGRPNGLGIFIYDNIDTLTHGKINIAVVGKWFTKLDKPTEIQTFETVKYHVFTGDMPNAILDEINLINQSTEGGTWKKMIPTQTGLNIAEGEE